MVINNSSIDWDVTNEIKKSFSKSSKNYNDLLYVLLFLIFALLFFVLFPHFSHRHYIWNPKNISVIEINWVNFDVSDVKVLWIPENVFDEIINEPEWSEYLLWEKKNVLFIYWDWCPYARDYDNQISKSFSETPLLKSYYSKIIIKVPQSYTLYCRNEYCPRIRLESVCWANFCIINPMAKEIIVDGSHKPSQISLLLNAYMSWNDKLLK